MDNRHTARRIVIKLGTSSVLDERGQLRTERLADLTKSIKKLHDEGREIILVSSGAVGMGRSLLNLNGALSLEEKQACAAIGQGLLMSFYYDLFAENDLIAAQLLLTARDLADRTGYLNLRRTFETLLAKKTIPIVNENDSVSVSELTPFSDKSFGDNDKLSALVAAKLAANLLVLLTDVDGIYDQDPSQNSSAKKISLITNLRELDKIDKGGSNSKWGRGGMVSKVAAARIASISGVTVVIAPSRPPQILDLLLEGSNQLGTTILPQREWGSRKRWIGFSCGFSGILRVNDGAKAALLSGKASLLPVGIVGVQGHFQQDQIVSVQSQDQQEIARGICRFSHEELRKIQGHRLNEISAILGRAGQEVIHRDDLVIFQEVSSEST